MRVFTSWMRFRIKRSQLLDLRQLSREIPFTFSELFRACLEALVSAEDRKALLRILKRHIPETVSTVLLGHWSFAG